MCVITVDQTHTVLVQMDQTHIIPRPLIEESLPADSGESSVNIRNLVLGDCGPNTHIFDQNGPNTHNFDQNGPNAHIFGKKWTNYTIFIKKQLCMNNILIVIKSIKNAFQKIIKSKKLWSFLIIKVKSFPIYKNYLKNCVKQMIAMMK